MVAHSYQLQARIEAGEISELYRGVQTREPQHPGKYPPREVTLKIFSARFSDRAYGEALATASRDATSVGHPGVVPYEDVGWVQGRLAAVRPYLDGYHLGTALSRLATREVTLTPQLALWIGLSAMTAVAAAHEKGVVHGALTPANVVALRDGRVVVTDFRALWAMQQSAPLRPLAARGRQAYRAPEVSKGFEPDQSADVYSLGAILYELLTLREVASMRGAGQVSTRRDVLVPPSRLDPRLSPLIDPLLMKALDPSKARRYASAGELSDAFRAVLAELGDPEPGLLMDFLGELFPHELTVGKVSDDIPFLLPFSLELPASGAILATPTGEVAARVSYSQPAPTGEDLELSELPPEAFVELLELTPVPEVDRFAHAAPPVSEWTPLPGNADVVLRVLSGGTVIPGDELLEAQLNDPLSDSQDRTPTGPPPDLNGMTAPMPQLPSAMLGALLVAPLPRPDMEAPPEALATQRSPPSEAAIAHQEREEREESFREISSRDLGAREKVKAAKAAMAQVRRPGAEAPPLSRGGGSRSARAETQPWDPPDPPLPPPRSTLWMWAMAVLMIAAAVALVVQALQTPPRAAVRHGRHLNAAHRSHPW